MRQNAFYFKDIKLDVEDSVAVDLEYFAFEIRIDTVACSLPFLKGY